MKTVNIGTKIHELADYLVSLPELRDIFDYRIYAGKPAYELEGMTLYFNLIINSPRIKTDHDLVNGRSLYKEGIFEFIIITNDVSIPDVEIFEISDIITNTICGKHIDLGGFDIQSIDEYNQGGVTIDIKDNPLLISQYRIRYKSLYEN